MAVEIAKGRVDDAEMIVEAAQTRLPTFVILLLEHIESLAFLAMGADGFLRPAADAGQPLLLDAADLVRQLVAAQRTGAPAGAVALGFHHAVAQGVLEVVRHVRAEGAPAVVALSGGVFANGLLTRLVAEMLAADGVTALRHRLVPPNDGGLALGQVAVGSRPRASAWGQHVVR